jgi:hypothetical protein
MTSGEAIRDLARAPAPGFRCIDLDGPERFMARVEHILNPPASAHALEKIHRALGVHAEQAAAYYARHDGFLLYADTRSSVAGIALLPAADWAEATRDMRLWLEDIAPENDPDHIRTGVAFASVPQSGNWFVIPVEGPAAGQVFYANHDGWYEKAFAQDFEGFLTRVATDPVRLLNEDLGGYTVYSDGETATQWVPEEYFRDVVRAARAS